MQSHPVRIPKLLIEREAAEAFGVSVDTIRRLRRAGKIAHTCIGGRIRYTEHHLTAYLERETRPCLGDKENGLERSADTGSASGQTALLGAEHGSTDLLDKHGAHRLAQRIFNKRS